MSGRIYEEEFAVMNREMVDRWVELCKQEAYDAFKGDTLCMYASALGKVQARLGDLAMGGTAREIAIEMIKKDLRNARHAY